MSQKYSIRAISLASLFIAIYSLFFSGRPISVDEQLYLTATRNISVLGKLSAEQLSGSIRLAGSYHGVEPAHPALASLWYKVFSSSRFVSWQVLYLLPIFYTAFSCVLLYLIAVRLGYEDKVGVILAILYGLSTMAFPYAKTFFREPLIVFLISGSWLAFLNFEHPKRHIRLIAFVSFFVFIALLILTKIPYLVVPITFFYIWIGNRAKTGKSHLYDNVIKATLLLVFFVSVFLFTTRNFTDQNMFYRFSGALFQDAINIILFAPHTHFFEVILGSLFSPLKGLIFYSPIILLGAYAMIRSWKKNKELFILPLVMLVTLLLVQALAHDDEWWTTPWGDRYLLPVVSLLIIASLPVLDQIIHLGNKAWFILGAFFLIGFFIQLPAVLFNSSHFAAISYASTPTSFSESLWNFSIMPIFQQWDMAKIPLYDLMIWRTFSVEPFLVLIVVLTAGVLFSFSLYCFFFPKTPKRLGLHSLRLQF